jgi:dTDP-4-dehydrorhamnose reductase
MRILVTGADGQVGRALTRAGAHHQIIAANRSMIDLTQPDHFVDAVRRVKPDVIINAAAYTAVDAAEGDEALAHAVNTTGAGELAHIAALVDAAFIHISTDYVFDGEMDRPYRESDETRPLNAYGRTKREGELAVLAAHPESLVVRTSWVFHHEGRNFVRTMIDLSKTRDSLAIVDDQRGAPTYAADLAVALVALAEHGTSSAARLIHLTASGHTTWLGLASAIFQSLKDDGRRVPAVSSVKTADWPAAATRPLNSMLDCSLAAETYGLRLPSWEDGLRRCLEKMSGPRDPDTEAQ